MKIAILISSLLVSIYAFAEGGQGKFDEHKQHAMERVDKKIEAMQNHKACIGSASDRDQLHSCRQKMKERRHQWREQGMKNKEMRMERKLDKLKEKRKNRRD